MKNFFRIIGIAFYVSGPLVVSFGTFSGLLLFLKVVFNVELSMEHQRTVYICYFVYLYLFAIRTEYKSLDKGGIREEDGITVTSNQKESLLRRIPLLSFLTGGVSALVDWILEKKKITFCDVFSRPSYWNDYPVDHKERPIIRMLKNNKSLEIRFPRSKRGLILVREAESDTGKFGEFHEESLLKWKEIFVLAPLSAFAQLIF